MKKILIIPLLLLLVACGSTSNNGDYYDMKEYTEMKANESKFTKDSVTDVINKLEKEEEGIYYIGYSECPYCQALVPVLNDVLVENDKTAYYLDVHSKDFTEEISNKLSKFDDALGAKASQGYVPFLVIIDDKGEIKTHVGTVDNHNASVGPLNNEQVKELKKLINDMLK